MDSGRLNAMSSSLTSINSSSPFTRNEEISRYQSGLFFPVWEDSGVTHTPKPSYMPREQAGHDQRWPVVSDPPCDAGGHHLQIHYTWPTRAPPPYGPQISENKDCNCGTPVLKGCQEPSFTITRFLLPQSSSLLPPRRKLLSLPPFLGWGGGPASRSLSKKVGKAKTKIVICSTNLPSLTFDVNLKTEIATATWRFNGSSICKIALWVENTIIEKWSLPVMHSRHSWFFFFFFAFCFFYSSPRDFYLCDFV